MWGEGIDECLKATVPDVLNLVAGDDIDLYYHHNSIGSVVAVTKADGTVVESYRYSAFGKPTIFNGSNVEIATTAVEQPFMFTGARYDFEEGSGLYQMRHRYFDPVVGRFVSRDPLGLWGDPSQSGNGQGYCGHNPVNILDPFGLDDYEFDYGSDSNPVNWGKLWDWIVDLIEPDAVDAAIMTGAVAIPDPGGLESVAVVVSLVRHGDGVACKLGRIGLSLFDEFADVARRVAAGPADDVGRTRVRGSGGANGGTGGAGTGAGGTGTGGTGTGGTGTGGTGPGGGPPPGSTRGTQVDIGGEGHHPGAVNVNPSRTRTNPGPNDEPTGSKIPDLVVGRGENLPFRSGVAEDVFMENVPLGDEMLDEARRITRAGGRIHLGGPDAQSVRDAADRIIQRGGGGQITNTGTSTRSYGPGLVGDMHTVTVTVP